jgi:hypothetical protein
VNDILLVYVVSKVAIHDITAKAAIIENDIIPNFKANDIYRV